MNIVVTGGAGFIGQALVRRLRGLNHRVMVADRIATHDSSIPCWTGDLGFHDAPNQAIPPGTEVVIHLAAATSVLGSIAHPATVYRDNVAVTQVLLERCRAIGVKQFIFCSTNAVAGTVDTMPISEETPLKPLTPYGATKAAGEMLVAGYASAYDLMGTILRLTNVYGPGMHRKDTIVARLMRAALINAPITIYGTGQQVRDYVYIEDVVNAFVLALEKPWNGPLVVGSGTVVSVNDLHRLTSQVCDTAIPVMHGAAPRGEMPAVRVDMTRARTMGFMPETSLIEGLSTVWDDFRRSYQSTSNQKVWAEATTIHGQRIYSLGGAKERRVP